MMTDTGGSDVLKQSAIQEAIATMHDAYHGKFAQPLLYNEDEIDYYEQMSFRIGKYDNIVIPAIDLVLYAQDIQNAKFIDRTICMGGNSASVYVGGDYESFYKLWHLVPEARSGLEADVKSKYEEAYHKVESATDDLFDYLVGMGADEQIAKEYRTRWRDLTSIVKSASYTLRLVGLPEREVSAELRERFEVMIRMAEDAHGLRKALDRWSNPHYFKVNLIYGGAEVTCHLSVGFNLFAATLARDEMEGAGVHFPAISESDIYVELRYDNKLNADDILKITNAYLYQLVSVTRFELEPTEHPNFNLDKFEFWREPLEEMPKRLRPVKMGVGLDSLHKMFLRANRVADLEVQVLYFTQIVEYVSATVRKIDVIEAIGNKLRSANALNPDARYILDLQEIVKRKNKEWDNDKDAVKETIGRCCDAMEVLRHAPPCLQGEITALEQAKSKREKKDKIEEAEKRALDAFANVLYNTRSQIVHAKANYTVTGRECPASQYGALVDCARAAADQAIRWYASRAEPDRVA